ncbi:MAG: hypothetical protein EB084_14460 [Proteobacteria bacterium]|nr:hypothetical protein [Pseudomonadota bacterium]
MSETLHPWQAALPALYHRAATDPEFRAICLKDARAALEAMGSVAIPADLRLRFVEHVDELVLPLPPASNGKLELDDLDAVAGGAVNVGTTYVSGPTVQAAYGYGYGYGYPAPVWPPVDPSTPSGLPPLVKPGGAPPGYNSI